MTTPIADLLAEPRAVEILRRHLGPMVDGPLPDEVYPMRLIDVAGVAVGIVPEPVLRDIADELTAL